MRNTDTKQTADFWWLKAPAPVGCVRTLDGDEFRLPEKMTLTDFDALCKRVLELPEGPQIELHRGVPFLHPSPNGLHQRFRSDLMAALHRRFEVIEQDRRFSAFGSDLRSEELQSYLTVDVMVVPMERADMNLCYMPPGVIPPMVIEVLSETTAHIDLGVKRELYLALGIPEFWACDPCSGAILSHVKNGDAYERVPADQDGFVWSPFLRQRVKCISGKWNHDILMRDG